jgi:hypothetical protein
MLPRFYVSFGFLTVLFRQRQPSQVFHFGFAFLGVRGLAGLWKTTTNGLDAPEGIVARISKDGVLEAGCLPLLVSQHIAILLA